MIITTCLIAVVFLKGKMGKEDLDFNKTVQSHIENIKIEEAKKEEAVLEEAEIKQNKKEENKNHPIFKEMRRIANSSELRIALKAYYDAISAGVIEEGRAVVQHGDIRHYRPFEIKIDDRFDDEDHYGYDENDRPFGAVYISFVAYFRTLTSGEFFDVEERDHAISFEIAYSPEKGLTFNGKSSLDDALDEIAKLTAIQIIENEKKKKLMEEERIKTRPERLKRYKERLLGDEDRYLDGHVGSILKGAFKALKLIPHGKYSLSEQEIKDLEDIKAGKDLPHFR